jgi:hypothetical protein
VSRHAAAFSQTLQEAQVDERVDEGVQIGDDVSVTQKGAFDSQGDSLGVNALDRRALAVELL